MEGTHDASPDTYKLWRVFDYPGSTKAVAMKLSHGTVLVSLYTTLITTIFVTTWSIVISLIILYLAPKKMTRTTYIAVIATWSCNDPYTAFTLMTKHAWRVGRGAFRKTHPAEFTWRAFGFDIVILVVAFVIGAGSIALSLLFSDMLVIGTAAPVNPSAVFYPYFNESLPPNEAMRLLVQYDSMAAMRAVGSVDSSQGAIEEDEIVKVEKIMVPDYEGEERYEVRYSYAVTGLEMGLQKLDKLKLSVVGSCQFKDGWYLSNETADESGIYEQYLMWPAEELVNSYPDLVESWEVNYRYEYTPVYRLAAPSALFYSVAYKDQNGNLNTGVSYYTIVPTTALRPTGSESRDPWYATQDATYQRIGFLYEVKRARPVLLCQQNDTWSYGDEWSGTMANLLSAEDDGPPVSIPEGIQGVLQPQWAYPMVANLGMALNSAALKSATRLLQGTNAIDTDTASAYADMSRLFSASYIATRDVFRNSALAGITLKKELGDKMTENALLNSDGTIMDGVGDFVISSSAIQALNFPALIAIPAILVFLFLIAGIFRAGRKVGKPDTDSGSQSRFDRYLMLVTGLQATQLYRMVDQLLAERAPDNEEGNLHRAQAQWKEQTSELPYVAGDKNSKSDNRIILPEFHVQIREVLTPPDPTSLVYPERAATATATSDLRLILGVKTPIDEQPNPFARSPEPSSPLEFRNDASVSRWRSLGTRSGDRPVKLAKVVRQSQEEAYYRSQLERGPQRRDTFMSGTSTGTGILELVDPEKVGPTAEVQAVHMTTQSASTTPEIEETKELR